MVSFRRMAGSDDDLPRLMPDTPRPARWISLPGITDLPTVVAYKLEFSLARETSVKIHLTADERYEFFVNGTLLARGPERGDPNHWFYESYEVLLPAGRNVFVGRVWSLGENAPFAQMSIRHGFLLFQTSADDHNLSTGTAPWMGKVLRGFAWRKPLCIAKAVGWNQIVFGREYDWGYELGSGKGWQPAEAGAYAESAEGIGCISLQNDTAAYHRLRPCLLPPMLDRVSRLGSVRHVALFATRPVGLTAILHSDCILNELPRWQQLLEEARPIVIPPFTRRRIIIDLKTYLCARPELTVSRGLGAHIEVDWSEALFENIDPVGPTENIEAKFWPKGDRNQIEGKFFVSPWSMEDGPGDNFHFDGGTGRIFTTLWWRAGRYIQLLVETEASELVLEDFHLKETRYPLEMEGEFACSDESVNALVPLLVRGLQSCAHETYIDCPFYEQLMYVGDTRLELLTTYVLTRDDRLPRKALQIFDWSRLPSGLTQSHYPSKIRQIIPPFSLWWIAMCHDYALWRDDRTFSKSLLPGVRIICDYFANLIGDDGLLSAPDGWNFTDWVPDWQPFGVPPGASTESSGVLNWQAIMTFRMAGELEDWFGEPETAALQKRRAQDLAKNTHQHFWNESRGIYADDLSHEYWSEHTQCLAILSGFVPGTCVNRLKEGLLDGRDLSRATIYFSHYLFEAYQYIGAIPAFLQRLEDWKILLANGLTTPVEQPEPTRSDCHAWGSHPLIHFYTALAGIRPVAPGFSKVRIHPQIGDLEWLRADLPHPTGNIVVEVRNGVLSISLPRGVELVTDSGRHNYV